MFDFGVPMLNVNNNDFQRQGDPSMLVGRHPFNKLAFFTSDMYVYIAHLLSVIDFKAAVAGDGNASSKMDLPSSQHLPATKKCTLCQTYRRLGVVGTPDLFHHNSMQ